VRAALAAGLLGVADLHELGALVGGQTATGGRTSVFRGVGMAIEDTAAAAALYEATARVSRPRGGGP
jgi:ornithine cyclodeaminase